MPSFLSTVATNVVAKYPNLANICFVLPNHRGGIYLKNELKKLLNNAGFLPRIITFDFLVEEISGLTKISQTELLFQFYKAYQKVTPEKDRENFENLMNWAPSLLNDFNEIDIELVSQKDIFRDLKRINEIQNWQPQTELSVKYLSFFQNIDALYTELSHNLLKTGHVNQGLLFKKALENLEPYSSKNKTHFIFVGFNYLRKTEEKIIEKLLKIKRAENFWYLQSDSNIHHFLDNNYLNHYFNKWAVYKKQNTVINATDDLAKKNIQLYALPQQISMMKYAAELLSSTNSLEKTAWILADQKTLPVALNSIPDEINDVNITMGLSLKQLPFSQIIKSLFTLHLSYQYKEKKEVYYKDLLRILEHPFILKNLPEIQKSILSIRKNNNRYFAVDHIQHIIGINTPKPFSNLFLPVETTKSLSLLERINEFIHFVPDKNTTEVLHKHLQLNQQLIQSVKDNLNKINLSSLFKIYTSLIDTALLNFIGEPLKGFQIMGFLESQNIDFERIIITSMNEGVLPSTSKKVSFIPFDIRKSYGLKTNYEESKITNQLFYSLLSKSKEIYLLYNNQVTVMGGGEMSRFLQQLLWAVPNVEHHEVSIPINYQETTLTSIPKTPELIQELKNLFQKKISPSALISYLYDPITFYQQYVLKLDEREEIEESAADNTLGSILHESLEELYTPFVGKYLTVSNLEDTLTNIRKVVQKEFVKIYKSMQIHTGKNKLILEVIIQFIRRFVQKEIAELNAGHQIKILALEEKVETKVPFEKIDFPIKFKGFIDRIDLYDNQLRIIDYKSGKVESSQLKAHALDKLITDYKYSKALQVLLYAYMYTQKHPEFTGQALTAGIYSFKNLNAGFLPVSFGESRQKDHHITLERLNMFMEYIEALILEILDPEISFVEKEQ